MASAIFFGTVLPKTFRIYRVFRRIRALKSSISDQRLLMQSGFIVAGNLLLLIIWFAVSAPKAVLTRGIDESKYICVAENLTLDTVMVNILLVYHGLLIAATTFLAFKVRVAKDVFNEAIPLGISVYGKVP
ncbi:7 transmembrane sweet-taste receptor of 3 GCPR-domain-containing protein [Paraphysoderma sedebokerense]|nr:7 transmembrane sweet-taste receptor of 3 GCPR-domain-containing protein [Paraphysoderma sedebokerense]